MADDLRRLLTYIIDQLLVQEQSKEVEIDATAVQDVPSEIAARAEEQRRSAERLAPGFADGLSRAMRGPVVVDDTDPTGSLIAEAFARYLVSTGLATSQSAPLPNGGYRYTFEVDWPALRSVGERAGVDVDASLK